MPIYDVTLPISVAMPVWPGDPLVQIEWVSSIARGDAYNVSRLTLGSHTGTHIDAPSHVAEGGMTVEHIPPELLIGPAFVVALETLESDTIRAEHLAALQMPEDTTRILLKTRNSASWRARPNSFDQAYVHLGMDAARWLIEREVRLLGVDGLSVEAFNAHEPHVHHLLLQSGMVVIEGLSLADVPAGPCRLLCLPLKIVGADGAPARVLVVQE